MKRSALGVCWQVSVLATALMLLDLHPVLTVGMMVFVAFFGIIWFLWAWIHFMGWLHSLVDKS